jgi:acyl-coenzyme A synthetase/AMP-(fatty) acid ligase
VVLREHARARAGADLQQEILDHCIERLTRHKVPREVVFVDDLPKNDRGKIDRRALAAQDRSS